MYAKKLFLLCKLFAYYCFSLSSNSVPQYTGNESKITYLWFHRNNPTVVASTQSNNLIHKLRPLLVVEDAANSLGFGGVGFFFFSQKCIQLYNSEEMSCLWIHCIIVSHNEKKQADGQDKSTMQNMHIKLGMILFVQTQKKIKALYKHSVSAFQHFSMQSFKGSVINKACGAQGGFQAKLKIPAPKIYPENTSYSILTSLKSWLFYFVRSLNLYVPLRIHNPRNSTEHIAESSWRLGL